MGRGRGGGGRGRGRGGGGRSRGSFRGRGHGRGRGQGRGAMSLSRKDTAHLRQFGESHPADAMSDFKSPSKKFKSHDDGKLRHGVDRFKQQDHESSEDEADSSEEDETTPYTELLSIFTGQKGKAPVQIVSESEEESDDSDNSEEISEGDLVDDGDVDSDVESLENGNEINPEEATSHPKNKNIDDKNAADDDAEAENEETAIPDETVIDDAESDSDTEDEKTARLDPFLAHFQKEISPGLQSLLSGNKPFENRLVLEWPTLEKIQFTGLSFDSKDETKKSAGDDDKGKQLLLGDPKLITKPPNSPPTEPGHPTLQTLHLKTQLHSTIPIVNQKILDRTGSSDPLSPLQQELLLLATAYHDVYFPQRNASNEDEVRTTYCIHVANHILKTRARILHHNAKMKNKIEVPEEYRDQGFVRPKVLILTPFKETALRIVKTLISLVLKDEKGNVQNKKRFVDEYGGETLFLPKTNPKPDDYMAMFSGNVDDNFKIGLAITKKSIKLYTGFYASDVIVASPLGLRVLVGAEGEKDRDYDFLSSIEVFVMDQADVFLMQNWDHLLHLVRHLHLQPITTHGTDFARIRPWALDNLTKMYCQRLVFSSMICPEHLALFARYARNFAGVAKIINPILTSHVSQIHIQLPQIFQQFECSSIAEATEARFEHFVNKVLPNFKGKLMSHTLIFVSSYFDFVKLRNFLRKEEQSFVQICEYTKDKKIARARDLFFHGKNKFLLYTERAHFFRRFRLKGIGHIIFYQLPQYPHFYSELCNFMQEGYQNRRVRQRKNCSVNVIYCKYDATRLASLVGTDRANHMLSSEKPTHAFVTEAL